MYVSFHSAKDRRWTVEEVANTLTRQADLPPSAARFDGQLLRVTVKPRFLDDWAKVDEVKTISKAVKPIFANQVARGILGADTDVFIPNDNQNFRGAGQVVAVADSGLDIAHPAFIGKVIVLFAGVPGMDINDRIGHGTHVCGSLLGSDTYWAWFSATTRSGIRRSFSDAGLRGGYGIRREPNCFAYSATCTPSLHTQQLLVWWECGTTSTSIRP